MKKHILIVFFTLSLIFSCDKVGEIIDEGTYEKPIIDLVRAEPENVNPGDTVVAVVVATNPEKGLLTYSWKSPDGGRFIEPSNKDTVEWIAPFSGGTYSLEVTVKNDKKSRSKSDDVFVNNLENPLVNISSPKGNSYFVQNDKIDVAVTAYHDNKLAFVRLLVNGTQIGQDKSYDASNDYLFSFNTDSLMVGDLKIKIIAVAFNQPENSGADSVTVVVGGILPKNGGN